jgi:hypothetical protein
MTYEEVVAYYGTAYRISKEGGFSKGAPYNWKKQGYIPIASQQLIQLRTKGKLRANLEHLRGIDVK